jgi:serine protease Do
MARWSIALVSLVAGGVAGVFLAGPLLQGQAPVPPVFPKELSSYRDVVKRVLPAVVMIEVKAKPAATRKSGSGKRQSSPFDDQRIPDDLRKFFEGQPQQFGDEDDGPTMGLGSGFVVDPKGVILTNNHVVDGASEVEVHFKDGRTLVSKDIKTDSKTDLAIVRVEAQAPLPYLELGDSDAMEIGDRVLAVGAPFGLDGSVTAGIISAKGRSLHMNMYEDFLQTDAAINPGNSGGPLVNLEGRVIGIDSAIKSRSGGFQGVGLAISSNLAKNIMEQLLKTGVVHRGYLGVQIKDVVDADLAKKLGVPTVVAGLELNKPVDLAVIRDGKEKTLQVTVQEQPGDFGTARVPASKEPKREKGSISLDKLGLEVTDLTPDLADELGYKDSVTGALITGVDRRSPAASAGLRQGMVISKVEKQPVKSAEDLRKQVDKAALDQGVLLQVRTPQGGSSYVLVKATAEKSEK